jgi:hypothetical protein
VHQGQALPLLTKGGPERAKAQLKPGKLINAIYIQSFIYIYLVAERSGEPKAIILQQEMSH